MPGYVWEWVEDEFGVRVQRGGSYLCRVSDCHRDNAHSRTDNAPGSSTGYVGFGLAADA